MTETAKRFRRRAMKWIRRGHLYAGLALVPFVALYGATGYLFNHPEIWSTNDVEDIPAERLDEFGRARLGDPLALASAVLSELGETDWTLDAASTAEFTGRSLLQATVDDVRYSLVVDEVDGAARLYSRPHVEREDGDRMDLAEGRELRTGREPIALLPTVADRLIGADAESPVEWRVRSSPRLEFGLLGPEGACRATYDLGRGTLETRPTDAPTPVRDLRSFLLRMHKAHGYPSGGGVRFVQAVLVDVMSFAMVAWAFTGLMMWWQMKNLRRVGLVVLALCAVGTTWLVTAQWAAR